MSSVDPTPQTENDAASASGSDSRKRNKLGYHRTALACGHCRRRKIRCIPSPEADEVRCQNCIRLQKNCQFYPVDQNPVSTRTSQSDSRADDTTTESFTEHASTSPDLPSNSITTALDMASTRDQRPYHGTWQSSIDVRQVTPTNAANWHPSMQARIQTQSPRQDSQAAHPATSFWAQNNEPGALMYSQQSYHHTPNPASYEQHTHPLYGNLDLHQPQHNLPRQQDFNTIPESMVQSPHAYTQFDTHRAPLLRSMTMPATYNQSSSNMSMDDPSNAPFVYAGSQDALVQPLSINAMQDPNLWAMQNQQSHMFGPGHPPPQNDRGYSEHPG